MNTVETSAKTIDAAIEEGLQILGAELDQVDVDILNQGGFLKKAKVKLTLKQEFAKQEKSEQAKAAPVQPKKEEKTKPEVIKTEVKKVAKQAQPVSSSEHSKPEIAKKFLQGFVDCFNAGYQVDYTDTEEAYVFNISGDKLGNLIGKNGIVMKAIDLIMYQCVNKKSTDKKRVVLNIEGYKEKREEVLKKLADKKADFVIKTGKYIKLDAMSAAERRIIHSYLQSRPEVKTFSSGTDPRRCLCIAPADKD